ncbi:hypothetical protein ACFVWG_20660 [Kribbella sp. NPDC058245]|uniref:hypothetical protein n=1 Tax=Kribbella sp. NPDC058245 TaxID=3346399 RepID=UPI0036E24ABF
MFDPLHLEATIEALVVDDDLESDRGAYVEELRGRVRAAKVTMGRARKALEAGWDPAELRDIYNAAAAEKQVAERALAALPEQQSLSRDQLVTYVDQLGDVGRALDAADPAELSALYEALKLGQTYNYADQSVGVEIDPLADRVAKYRVRGGTPARSRRIPARCR